jgi:hypothetical protein
MPAGDLTEVAQGGATLSGGQKARVSLARAVYRAVVAAREGTAASLVLLDDPLCSLDRRVARQICASLFAPPGGLLTSCAVVVATADPWWLSVVAAAGAMGPPPVLQVAVLRAGRVVAAGPLEKLAQMHLPELRRCHSEEQPQDEDLLGLRPSTSTLPGTSGADNPQEEENALVAYNPQDDSPPCGVDSTVPAQKAKEAQVLDTKAMDSHTQTELTEAQKKKVCLLEDEHREEGQVKSSTYVAYLSAVGYTRLGFLLSALTGIMIFEALCSLWITYWTDDSKAKNFMHVWMLVFTKDPPRDPITLLKIYAYLVLFFTLFNFIGHSLEILGGISAARKVFRDGLVGTLAQPFRWWDANPTGRVLNRFSGDVEIMDAAVTNIMGVIFGAVLYFVGHCFILCLSNPGLLILLPPIAAGLEYYARYYRTTIREIQLSSSCACPPSTRRWLRPSWAR